MNGQPSYLVGDSAEIPTMIKQEQIYPSYGGDNHQAANILRDAFMLTMSDEGIAAGHNISVPAAFAEPQLEPVMATAERPTKQRHIYESPEARARRLARNAERMRERRSNETEEEYRIRREKMAAANRQRRLSENELEKAMRHLRDAARQRLRRAMESPEQRATRLEKLAERSRISRMNETPEQKAERNRKCLESNKLRYQRRQAGLIPKAKSRKEKLQNALSASAAPPQNPTPEAEEKKMPQLFSKIQPITDTSHSLMSSPNNSYDNLYSTYQSYKSSPFPDLPPHIAPNQPKYYGHIQNFVPPQTSSLQYIPSFQQNHNVHPTQIPAQTQLLQPTTSHVSQSPYNTHAVYAAQPQMDAQPEITRGRPIKILPSNNYQTVAPALQQEAVRQHKLNNLLEEQINIIMTSPKQGRGRPSIGSEESDQQREERLRKMREARKLQRDLETPEQREARLKDLSERARKRRINLLSGETEDERRERLKKQAEYARERRNRSQTPQAYRQAQQDAKNLYAKLHNTESDIV